MMTMQAPLRRLPLLFLFLIVGFSGCGLLSRPQLPNGAIQVSREREDEYLAALSRFEENFENLISEAGYIVTREAESRDARKNASLYKVRAVARLRDATRNPNPAVALLECWALAIRMRQHITTGEGSDLFADKQDVAVRATELIQADIEATARELLTLEEFEEIQQQVTSFAVANPFSGLLEESRAPSIESQGLNFVTSVARIPFAPFRTFDSVNSTAESIREFNRIAGRFADIVEDTPREARWQLEIFTHMLEESDLVTSLTTTLEQLALDVRRTRELAEDIPRIARETVRESMEEVSVRLPEIQTTISEARGLVQDADALTTNAGGRIAEVQETLGSVRSTADELERVAIAYQGTIDRLIAFGQLAGMGRERAPGEPPGRPFDIREYDATAQSLTRTALELQGVLDRVNNLLESPALRAQLDEAESAAARTVSVAQGSTRELIDHLFVRLLQLILIAGAILAAGAWWWRRLRS
jgi:methyl-accepting chemotaxis protein